MSMHRCITLSLSFACLAHSAYAQSESETVATPAAAIGNDATLESYVKPSGESYFSLSLATSAAADTRPRDVVVLFDSSASQAGKYRASALDALSAMLKSLQPTDRVRLMSVDLGAIEMNKSFDAPTSTEVTAGVAKIKKRVPLGTTDMVGALDSAIKVLADQAGSAKTVVYIGDGNSAAKLIDSDAFGDLVSKLAESQITVSSYAVGPQVNSQMLAALANHTGGVMAVEKPGRVSDKFAATAGKYLGESVRAAVVWPTKVEWPADFGDVYPVHTPPLRSDRGSVVVGTTKKELDGPVAVKMTADVAGKTTELDWSAKPKTANDDNSFLPQLVKAAKVDGGLSLPTIGPAGLAETGVMVRAAVARLNQLAQQAVATGRFKEARRLAGAAAKADPGDEDALRLKGAADLAKDAPFGAVGGEDDGFARFENEDGGLLATREQQESLIERMTEADVNSALKLARKVMPDDCGRATAQNSSRYGSQYARGSSGQARRIGLATRSDDSRSASQCIA